MRIIDYIFTPDIYAAITIKDFKDNHHQEIQQPGKRYFLSPFLWDEYNSVLVGFQNVDLIFEKEGCTIRDMQEQLFVNASEKRYVPNSIKPENLSEGRHSHVFVSYDTNTEKITLSGVRKLGPPKTEKKSLGDLLFSATRA